ncbi:MAG: hypothetical protein HOM41_00260, partial [Flavobacteriales bacterium]|nr:hypothetical protein [Flavobacteriales bacterium]
MITFRPGIMVLSIILGLQVIAPNNIDAQFFKKKNKKEPTERGKDSDAKSISK